MIQSTVLADTVPESIAAVIVEHLAPRRVVLFGSRARGDAREHSDYDVMVEVDTELETQRSLTSVHAALRDLGRDIDIILRTATQFERDRDDVGTMSFQIARDGRVLYRRDDVVEPAFERRVNRVREEPNRAPRSLVTWIERAESDFHMMELGMAATPLVPDAVCFHAHQGVEKLLKALIVSTNTPLPHTHELDELLAACPLPQRHDETIVAACLLLKDLWPKSRYPEAPMPTFVEATEAAKATRAVRRIVLPALERAR
jgi:HEPN domain-containing protein/predicted nucleotidyltransferase